MGPRYCLWEGVIHCLPVSSCATHTRNTRLLLGCFWHLADSSLAAFLPPLTLLRRGHKTQPLSSLIQTQTILLPLSFVFQQGSSRRLLMIYFLFTIVLEVFFFFLIIIYTSKARNMFMQVHNYRHQCLIGEIMTTFGLRKHYFFFWLIAPQECSHS